MSDILRMQTSFATYLKFSVEGPDCAPAIEVTHFVHRGELHNFETMFHGGHMGDRPAIAAELVLSLEDFDADFFSWGGCMFVSERMREVMAIAPSDIRFFEIDDSQSAPLPQSKNYWIMEPLVFEDVLDPAKSDFRMGRISPDGDLLPLHIDHVVVRPNAAPKHDLFYDRFFWSILLCTKRFAERVMEAGCTGVEFVDPSKNV